MEQRNPDRIVYSESRTINLGNYEKIETFFSYSKDVKYYNLVDKSITLRETETMTTEGKDFEENVKILLSRVKKVLDHKEKQIRTELEKKQDFANEF